MRAQHSAATCEHGTPKLGVDLARGTLGSIDLDPFSSDYWNRHAVKARRYLDREADGLKQAWSGRVFVNPPGADKATGAPSLVRPAWEKLIGHWSAGDLGGAVWWGYSLEQLQMLQRARLSPLRFVTLVLAARPRHLVRGAGDGPPTEGTAPTHSGYVTLLHSLRSRAVAAEQICRFVRLGRALGVLVQPAREAVR